MQREWLGRVDEAYWSGEGSDGGDDDMEGVLDSGQHTERGVDSDVVDGVDRQRVKEMLDYWAAVTGVELDRLVCTTYRAVKSDVGKSKSEGSEMEKVSALAVAAGGGW